MINKYESDSDSLEFDPGDDAGDEPGDQPSDGRTQVAHLHLPVQEALDSPHDSPPRPGPAQAERVLTAEQAPTVRRRLLLRLLQAGPSTH